VGGEIQAKSKWYEEERDNLTKAEEDAYLKVNAEKSFLLHVLEIRLAHLRHLATARYQAIETLFHADKRLSVLYY
jgi:hypothetical protein